MICLVDNGYSEPPLNTLLEHAVSALQLGLRATFESAMKHSGRDLIQHIPRCCARSSA
jgi:hypothetical protein